MVSGAEFWISGMEIGVLEMAGNSGDATLWAGGRGGVAAPTLGRGRARAPQPPPLTLCPNLSPPEGTKTKVCLLEALAQDQTMLCQESSSPEDSVYSPTS